MIDYCGVTKQIAQFPHENVKKWGIEKVRDLMAYKSHVEVCLFCSTIMDTILDHHKDDPKRFDPTSLN